MIKVLSIGNSFSYDAHRYLHNIAKNEGVDMKCANIFIGGCSLRTHYVNMLENSNEYTLGFNGDSTGIKVTIGEALASDDWDFVTLQQASHFSYDFNSYTPYIEKLAEYIRTYAPKAKILVHQTWAYEQDSPRLTTVAGYSDQHDMLNDIREAYNRAAAAIGADGIIPCGEIMMKAIDAEVCRMHRDGFHADLGIGRYATALTWYKTLTGDDIKNDYENLDVETSAVEREKIRDIVNNHKI